MNRDSHQAGALASSCEIWGRGGAAFTGQKPATSEQNRKDSMRRQPQRAGREESPCNSDLLRHDGRTNSNEIDLAVRPLAPLTKCVGGLRRSFAKVFMARTGNVRH